MTYVDDGDELDDGVDEGVECCHHGVPYSDECEACEVEDELEVDPDRLENLP